MSDSFACVLNLVSVSSNNIQLLVDLVGNPKWTLDDLDRVAKFVVASFGRGVNKAHAVGQGHAAQVLEVITKHPSFSSVAGQGSLAFISLACVAENMAALDRLVDVMRVTTLNKECLHAIWSISVEKCSVAWVQKLLVHPIFSQDVNAHVSRASLFNSSPEMMELLIPHLTFSDEEVKEAVSRAAPSILEVMAENGVQLGVMQLLRRVAVHFR